MVCGVPDVITCAKFQIEIFMGYDFTGGRILDFCIDFSMGLTTVQRYCAACDRHFYIRPFWLEIAYSCPKNTVNRDGYTFFAFLPKSIILARIRVV